MRFMIRLFRTVHDLGVLARLAIQIRKPRKAAPRGEQKHAMNTNSLIVRKENGLFVLRSFRNGERLESVQARDAQAIIDHVSATWPPGTVIQWFVQPSTSTLQLFNPSTEAKP